MPVVQRIELGYNNVYVAQAGGGRIMIDTGPDYRGASERLRGELRALPDIIVATHGHLDHAGLGRYWQDKGVPVAMAAADLHLTSAPQLASPGEFSAFVYYVRRSGAPEDVQVQVISGLEMRRQWALAAARPGHEYPSMGRDPRWPSGLQYEHFEPSRIIHDGEWLFGSFEVVLCPGHTPGNLVVVNKEAGWLFSGDQLLPDITPTPAIQPKPGVIDHQEDWRFRSLPAFVAALERLRTMPLTRCYPGHGHPFDDVQTVIEANLAQIEQRSDRVLQALANLGCATVYQLCDVLYPRVLRRRFWQIMATVQGHLDLLEAQAQVRASGDSYEMR